MLNRPYWLFCLTEEGFYVGKADQLLGVVSVLENVSPCDTASYDAVGNELRRRGMWLSSKVRLSQLHRRNLGRRASSVC